MSARITICVGCFLLLSCRSIAFDKANFEIRNEVEFSKIMPPASKLKKLAGGMKFTEGPVWIASGNGYLIFTDIPGNELKKWSPETGLVTFRPPDSRFPDLNCYNGNILDRDGRLLTCGQAARCVTRTEKDGSVVTLVDHYNGRKLNSPNDIVVKSDGVIYFTDPDYGIEPKQREQPGNYVFRLNPSSGELRPVSKDFLEPNGLCFSPDEKKLYVDDSSSERHDIWVFDVQPDGTLQNGKAFCVIHDGAPDGIRCDADGRLYSASAIGVQVFAPDGGLIGKILVPEKATANLCFGDADRKTLYITASTSLYSIRLAVTGAQ
jgi:gluconolactonase